MKRVFHFILILLFTIALLAGGLWLYLRFASWGFARAVPSEEKTLRTQIVTTAESWLGTHEGDVGHEEVLAVYNAHEPLAQGYLVTRDDNWCATFCSTVAIQCGIADIIPTECGCQRQIGLWQNIGRWEEDDSYIPLPGDYIYYAWDEQPFGDCTGWADHVGIVVGTAGPFIKVIEGNKDDSVSYRIIPAGHYQIRGYGLPDYASKSES